MTTLNPIRILATLFRRLTGFRTPLGQLNAWRLLRGGRLSDAGRLPRYLLIFVLAAAGIWAPIIAYVKYTPPSFTSDVSLILPGAGASASVNLADIGQASSSASSAFSSTRISPTQTYKRLLTANRVLETAARSMGIALRDFGSPQITLVDETSLIHFSMKGGSPENAQARSNAVLQAFLAELDLLRNDELDHRAKTAQAAIAGYAEELERLRAEISRAQTESGLVSFAHYQDMVAERDALQSRVETAASTLASADARALALKDRLNVDPEVAALSLRLQADPEFQHLADALSRSATLLAEKRSAFGARHPQVTDAASAFDGAERSLFARAAAVSGMPEQLVRASVDISPDTQRSRLLAALVDLAAECEGMRAEHAALSADLAAMTAELARLAPMASRLDDLTRDHQLAEAVFTSAMARNDTSKAEVFASYPLVQVLQDAALPDSPSSPKKMIALAAGIMACLMIFVALVLAWIRRPLIDRIIGERDAA